MKLQILIETDAAETPENLAVAILKLCPKVALAVEELAFVEKGNKGEMRLLTGNFPYSGYSQAITATWQVVAA